LKTSKQYLQLQVMIQMPKEIPVHKDILGNLIKVGDTVVYPDRNSLSIATVQKINPKMINVVACKRTYPDRKYPSDLLVVNDPKITLYLLKNSK
jgi:hypothetical protein